MLAQLLGESVTMQRIIVGDLNCKILGINKKLGLRVSHTHLGNICPIQTINAISSDNSFLFQKYWSISVDQKISAQMAQRFSKKNNLQL